MKTRIFWGTFAALAFILLIPLCIAFNSQYQVYSKGNIIEVTITSLPGKLVTNGNMKFEFNGKTYSKSVNGNVNNYLHIGDKIQMKHLARGQIFLFINENPMGWGIFVILMVLISGICFIYYAIKTDTPSVQVFGRKLT